MAKLAKHEEQLVIEHVPIGDLHPDPFNPRRISDAELEAAASPLGASLPNTTRELCLMAPLQTGGRPKKSLELFNAGRATSIVCALPD
jgi:hypothetical protein